MKSSIQFKDVQSTMVVCSVCIHCLAPTADLSFLLHTQLSQRLEFLRISSVLPRVLAHPT